MRSPMARRMRREHEEHATELQLAQTATAVSSPAESPERRLFFNREISWLDFNDRVLQLAESPDVPLLERVKFCAIYARNLDEFFMIRVTLLRPALAEKGIRIARMDELTPEARAQIDHRFREQIFPVLTPLAIGLGRHFPYISNVSLSLAVLLHDPVADTENVARIKVPKELLPRFVPVKGTTTFVPLEHIISQHLGALFPGMEILDVGFFRVTRDADFTVSEDAEDLLRAVEVELRQRRFGEVIRVEVSSGMNPRLLEPLVEALGVGDGQIYHTEGLLDLGDLADLTALPGFSELRD